MLDIITAQHRQLQTEIKYSSIEEIRRGPFRKYETGLFLFPDSWNQTHRLLGLDLGKGREDLQRVVMNDSDLVRF